MKINKMTDLKYIAQHYTFPINVYPYETTLRAIWGREGVKRGRRKAGKEGRKSVSTLGVSLVLQIKCMKCLLWFYLGGIQDDMAWNRKVLRQIWESQNPKTAKEGYHSYLASGHYAAIIFQTCNLVNIRELPNPLGSCHFHKLSISEIKTNLIFV